MTWLVVLMYATWSSVFTFGKVVLTYTTPLFLTSVRMLLAGVLMLAYITLRKRSSFRMGRAQWLSIGLLALMSIFLTNVLEFWGLQYLSAAKTCFIYSLSPFFAALFSYLHFKEKMTRRKWLGMGIGVLGVVPVLITQTGSEELLNAFSFFTWPTLAIMGAALFSVYGWVILRLVVKDHEISPIMANGSSMLLGGTMALITSLFVDTWNPVPVASGGMTPFVFGTLGMTFLYNIVCYNLYGWMLKRFTATFLSFMGLLSPVFASLTGWIFLGELPSWQILLSTGVVSIGLWIVYQAELKQGYIKKQEKIARQAERS
ncbi:MAG: S-adenosylmethionine/S-adenosylhomocysteine transporter [Chlamydiae bacterium]|nr:S-adenosylmethionine/S-adenosylhomocysteine transporter [Chlamydiota bacterium]